MVVDPPSPLIPSTVPFACWHLHGRTLCHFTQTGCQSQFAGMWNPALSCVNCVYTTSDFSQGLRSFRWANGASHLLCWLYSPFALHLRKKDVMSCNRKKATSCPVCSLSHVDYQWVVRLSHTKCDQCSGCNKIRCKEMIEWSHLILHRIRCRYDHQLPRGSSVFEWKMTHYQGKELISCSGKASWFPPRNLLFVRNNRMVLFSFHIYKK